MAESKEELKSLLMKLKEENENADLKLNIQKMKISASSPITSWQIDGETMETVKDFIFGGLQNHCRWWPQPWNNRHLLFGRKAMTHLVKVAQSCPNLCDPMDYPVHGILQARILKWVTFPFSRGSSQPRDQTQVSPITGVFLISWATRKAQEYCSG